MDILRAFNIDIESKRVISLVGAGGKTSTMFKLAHEMKTKKKRVLATTTTAIFYPPRDTFNNILITKEYEELLKGFEGIKDGSITVVGYWVSNGKLMGIPKEWIDSIAKQGIFDSILVEADGSKGRPIKAPEYYEPVIPRSTDLVIGVVGIDAFGKAINEEWVHRPEKLIKIAKKNMNDTIDGEDIAKLVISKEGLFKDSPVGAKKIVFFNKVLSNYEYQIAMDIGKLILLKEHSISRIVIGAIKESKAIKGIMEDK